MSENNQEAVNIKDLKGVKLDLKTLAENERVWKGQLEDMVAKKTQKDTPYWIFSSSEDENGVIMQFTTFSSTQKAVIEDALIGLRPLGIVYQLPAKFGSFNVVSAELPDGTFSAKEAREAWKKGNKANNRATVIQSAVALVTWQKFDAGLDAINQAIAYAEELLKWVEKEDK